MEWVLNNLDNVIIPLIIAVLYFVGNAAQKKAKADKPGGPPAKGKVDPDEAKRVSEIQEEIRRKIAQRTGRMPPSPPPVPGQKVRQASRKAPQSQKQFPMPAPKPARVVPPPPPPPTPAFPIDTYQQEIEAKMKRVRELEARAKSMPVQADWGSDTTRKASRSQLKRDLFSDLAHPLGQKKAILISEILGPPIGVKGPSGWKANV